MKIQSFTNSDIVYETTVKSCTCKHFIYVCEKNGLKCKHQKSMIENLEKKLNQSYKNDKSHTEVLNL